MQDGSLRVSLYINAFISQEREGGSLAGGPRHNILALGHELRSILQRSRREERRGEAVDFLSLRGGLKRVKEKRAAEGEAGAGRGLEKPLLTLQGLPKVWAPGPQVW